MSTSSSRLRIRVDVDLPVAFEDLYRPARYKVYHGGRGGGKSWAFCIVLIMMAAARPLRILCAREYQNSIEDSVYKALIDTIRRLKLQSQFRWTKRGIYSRCGSQFIFKGLHNNEDDIKSTEGVDICWVEEGQSVSDPSWAALMPTIRKPGSEIWVSMNAKDVETPAWKRFVLHPPPSSVVEKVNYYDNPFITEELLAEMRWCREYDPEAYKWIWLGFPKAKSDAQILADKVRIDRFADDLWVEPELMLYQGADFGFAQDPSTLIRSFVLDRKLYVQHEAWGLKVELNDFGEFYDRVPGSRDWPIKADGSRPETISHIAGMGFAISAAEKWPGSVEDGIAHLRGFDEIVIHERCKHTIEESELYRYKVDKMSGKVTPHIVDAHNHCWDAIRYSLDGFIQARGSVGIWSRLGG